MTLRPFRLSWRVLGLAPLWIAGLSPLACSSPSDGESASASDAAAEGRVDSAVGDGASRDANVTDAGLVDAPLAEGAVDADAVDAHADGASTAPCETCDSGSAAPTCSATTEGESCEVSPGVQGTCCGQACIDTAFDSNNCSKCGTMCPSGTFCAGNECSPIPSCAPSSSTEDLCPLAASSVGLCCAGSCTDVESNSGNCGACGLACPTGSTCVDGACTTPGAKFPSCTTSGACPSGDLCVEKPTNYAQFSDGVCLKNTCPAGATGSPCAFGPTTQGTCCDGACVNLDEDAAHCGSCSGACASGLCGDSNVDVACLSSLTSSDFIPCVGPVGFCSAPGGAGVCCPSEYSFACSNIATDPMNCGGCGNACKAGQTCTAGVCSGAAAQCGAGKIGAYCDLPASASSVCCGDQCIDVSADPSNCGKCGNVCLGGSACVDSVCS